MTRQVHSHFHRHDTLPAHPHAHQDGDPFTAHAHSSLLVDPPAAPRTVRRLSTEAQKQLVVEAMRTGDWAKVTDDALDAAEKVASPENTLGDPRNLRGDVRAHTRGGAGEGKRR